MGGCSLIYFVTRHYSNENKKRWIVSLLFVSVLIQILYVFFTVTLHAQDYPDMSVFTAEGSFVCYFDRCFYPSELLVNGLFYRCVLAHFSSISIALIGTVLSLLLYNSYINNRGKTVIALSGILMIVIGLILDKVIPLNKRLWSSSFILLIAGIDIVLLVLLNILFDKKTYRHKYLLESFGNNTIALYLLEGSGVFMQLGTFICSTLFIILSLQSDFYNQLVEFVLISAFCVILANKNIKINV